MGFSRDTLSWAPAWRQALMGTKAWDVPEKLPKRSGQKDCSSSARPSTGTHVLLKSLAFIFLIVDKGTCRITIKSL